MILTCRAVLFSLLSLRYFPILPLQNIPFFIKCHLDCVIKKALLIIWILELNQARAYIPFSFHSESLWLSRLSFGLKYSHDLCNGNTELGLEISLCELLHERSKLLPSFIQEPANENWICSPLDSFTRINSSHFPASVKYGQIENFPVAPSNTACLENPPVFLTREFNFSLTLTFASCFPLLKVVQGAFHEKSK